MYFEFFIGMGWDKVYLLDKIDICIEKVEKIFGGRNNMTYVHIQGQKADLLTQACLEETGSYHNFATAVAK